MGAKETPPCFGSPDPFSPACRVCGRRVECFEHNYGLEDIPVLIAPKPVVRAERRVQHIRYADEKPGAKPWERKEKQDEEAE